MTTSLTRQVAAAINRRGNCTAADLLPDLPGCTLRQVIDALHNAKVAGLISLKERGRSLGRGRGWAASTYGIYDPNGVVVKSPWRPSCLHSDRRRPVRSGPTPAVLREVAWVASVWDLGLVDRQESDSSIEESVMKTMRPREAAKALSISMSTFYYLAKNDETFPPLIKIGPKVTLIRVDDIDAFLEKKARDAVDMRRRSIAEQEAVELATQA